MGNFGLSPKPVSQQLYDRLNSQNSLAPVYVAGEPMPSESPVAVTDGIEEPETQSEQPQVAATFSDDAIVGRINAIPCKAKKDIQERSQLLSDLMVTLHAADVLEARCRKQWREEITIRWKEARKAARAQLAVVSKAQRAVNVAESRVANSIEEQRYCKGLMAQAVGERLPAYSTDEEESAKKARIEQARAKCREADRESGFAVGARYSAQSNLKAEQEKMSELGALERRLRHALDGRSYYDPEFGLMVRP